MNKYARAPIFCAATIISLLFFSCGNFSGLSIPEKVSIKTSAEYSGALGQKYFDLTEKLGTQMLDEVSQKAEADVYKYIPNPSDATLKYLLHRKLYDVQIDVGKYIDDMDFDASLNDDMDFEATIAIPTVSISQSLPIPGDPGAAPITLPNLTANVTLESSIKSAKIKKGSVIVRATGSGAVYDITAFTLTGVAKNAAGTQAYAAGDFGAGGGTGTYLIDKKLDLADAYITIPASQVTVGGTLTKQSGTISGTGTLTFSIVVEELDEVVIDMTQYGSFVMNSTSANKTKVSADMVKYVTTMDFGQQPTAPDGYYYKSDAGGNITATKGKGKGVKFNVVNSLPAGNDIALEIKSTTFGIDSTDGMYVNGESAPASDVKIPAKGNASKTALSFAEFTSIDVTDSSKFGTASSPAYINFSVTLSDSQKLNDLRMGSTYKIAISDSEVLMDWDKVGLKLNSLNSVTDESDLSDFSIDEMLKEIDNPEMKKLINNSELVSLPVYFLVQKPVGALADLVSGITFNGKIYLTYTEASEPEYIVGSSGAAASLSLCEPMLWPSLDKVVTKKFVTEGTDFSFYKDIAYLLNERATNLKVNYNISVSGGSVVDLYKARLDSMSSSDTCDIAVEMAAVLPLHFKTKNSTTMDLYGLANMDVDDKDDLLDRSDVSKTKDYEDNASSIKYLRINYNLINSALDGLEATIDIDDTHAGEPNAAQYSGITRTLHVTGNNQSDDVVDFKPDEIQKVLTHFFKPKMTLTVAKDVELKVWRHAVESPTALGISPVITLKLDENSPIDIKDLIK